MVLNENMIKGKWNEVKGDIRRAWGKITDDDLDKHHGDVESIAGLIQQRYGVAQEKARETINGLFERFAVKGEDERRRDDLGKLDKQ